MSTPLPSFVILHSAPSPPTLGSTPTGVVTAFLKNELLMSNGMGSQFEAIGRGHDCVCFDCKYSQAVFLTSCVRNESEQTADSKSSPKDE